jgi:CRP-like cAMP-binding protein
MYDLLIHKLKSIVPFEDAEIVDLLSVFKLKKYKKGTYFIEEGIESNYCGFINKGIMRLYYVNDDKEYTTKFFGKGDWFGEYESFINRAESKYYIEAVEDTEVLRISYEDTNRLYEKHKVFERFGRILAERLYISLVNDNARKNLYSAAENYQRLIKEQPDLFKQVPLKYIASYLGVAPGSLSRIRKRINEKK